MNLADLQPLVTLFFPAPKNRTERAMMFGELIGYGNQGWRLWHGPDKVSPSDVLVVLEYRGGRAP